MEPTTVTTGSVLLSKLWFALGGLFSSSAVGAFWRPAALEGYGKVTKGIIIGGIGAGAPAMFGGFLALQLGLDPYTADIATFIGGCISLLFLFILVLLVNFFKKREEADLLEVVQEVKGHAINKKPAVKKPAVKRTKPKVTK